MQSTNEAEDLGLEYQPQHAEWIIKSLMTKYHFITLADTKEILFYENGVYKSGGEIKIEIETEKINKQISTRQVNEIQNHIRRRTMIERSELNSNSHIINCKNCLLDTRDFKKYPHTPEFLSTIQLPVEYNPKANCPQILNFLQTTIHRSDVKIGLALVACAITGDNANHLAGLAIGSGNNGKSVWNGLIEALFGKNNVSHVALQELDGDKFAAADFYGKLLNICGDLPIRPLKDTGIFKKIVSGDTIRAQRKHQQPFDFSPKGILMFSTNKLPDTPDQTLGFYRRFVYLHFPNNFEGREDRQLLSKLTTDEELSGLLNLILESIKWQRRKREFPGLESVQQREETYNKIQNSVEFFLDECVETKEGESITKDEMHEVYVSWCKSNNVPAETKEGFGKKLSQIGYKTARKIINGNRPYVWKDISLIKPKEE